MTEEMIELAPRHKFGLALDGPLMAASGTFGYGDVYQDFLDLSLLGAIVTNPVSWRPRRAAAGQRIGVRDEHFVIHTGWPNPGVRRAIRTYGEVWERSPVPVIVHLLATRPSEVHRAAARLSGIPGVRGVELGFVADTEPERALSQLEAAADGGDLPVIAQIPFGRVGELASLLTDHGADALVLTAPPRAVLPLDVGVVDGQRVARYMRGRLYSAALFPILLDMLSRWADKVSVPVIACGGIASAADAMACLNLGASALQIDALLWRDPTILGRIARKLSEPLPVEPTVSETSNVTESEASGS